MRYKVYDKNGVKYKQCTKCLEHKPVTEFYIQKEQVCNPYFSTRCKACLIIMQSEYRERQCSEKGIRRQKDSAAAWNRKWGWDQATEAFLLKISMEEIDPELWKRMIDIADELKKHRPKKHEQRT